MEGYLDKAKRANDPEFINGLLTEIKKHVLQFATIGGHYQENKDLIDDMVQEASLEVLKKYQNHHSTNPFNVDGLRKTIYRACQKIISNSKTITVPLYWLRNEKNSKGAEFPQDSFVCYDYSAIEEFAVPSEYLISSFEESVSNQIIVADLLQRASEKERKVFRLIGAGFTLNQIETKFGINHAISLRYLDRARRYLTTETNENRKGHRKGTGDSSRRVA